MPSITVKIDRDQRDGGADVQQGPGKARYVRGSPERGTATRLAGRAAVGSQIGIQALPGALNLRNGRETAPQASA